MNLPMGAIAGTAVGILGAAAWAAVAYFANLEIGWLAWGIGAAVGIATAAGAAFGSGDAEGGPALGAIAVLITILSLCAGKYAIVEISLQEGLAQWQAQADGSDPMSDEVLVSYLADEIGETEHGEDWYNAYEWPDNPEGIAPDSEALYPPELWKPAQAKWDRMTPDERAAYRKRIEANLQEELDLIGGQFANQQRQQGFFATFSAFDLLFFGLAIVTAWRLASGAESG